MTYNPVKKTADLLNWMLEKIKSVEYGVTLRWTFYQAVQEKGLKKSDYKNIKKYCSKSRKDFWNGWNPTTLVDDTRTIYRNGGGYDNFYDWLNSFMNREPTYEVYSRQENIVQIWFEAQAMYSQFNHYASPYRIPLVPFKGDTSINAKWKMAEYLAELYEKYRKPIIILYFGDYEPHRDRGSRAKGLTIPMDALDDVLPWFASMIIKNGVLTMAELTPDKLGEILTFKRIGLNEEHIKQWELPENPERPGEFQWEALNDERARDLIKGAIEEYWDRDVIIEIQEKEKADGITWNEIAREAIERYKKAQE
uniref:Uncharacterized protein n=1 Tax=viral metagenome TaxID=1070528 RepID=A0A6M3MAD5_9ZZZZ